jgi:hypothetical protein
MPYVGEKGGASYPAINRARLISGDEWIKGVRPGEYKGVLDRGLGQAVELRKSWSSRSRVDLSSSNRYGFSSRSESLFPEAYKPIDTKFWQPLNRDEYADLIARQAVANMKATFQDEDAMPVASTSADENYALAAGRRSQSMRRRKPMNHHEKKKLEEAKKKDTLLRRFSGSAEVLYRNSTSIIRSGPIDTPVVVSGLPVYSRMLGGEAPKKLRRMEPKRGVRRRSKGEAIAEEPELAPEVGLPSFNPNAAPRAKLTRWTNSYGLVSRSEMLFPEAYKDLSTVYWRRLNDDERNLVMQVQARAMEKVGYERGTSKQFIDEIFPEDDYSYLTHRRARTDDTRPGATLSVESWVTVIVLLSLLGALAYFGWQVGDDVSSSSNIKSSAPPALDGD